MPKIVKFFQDVQVTSSGVQIANVVGGIKHLVSGTFEQVVVNVTTPGSPSATEIDIQLRYITGNSDRDKLVYVSTGNDITSGSFAHSNLTFPFSLHNQAVDGDLYLYLQSDADCTCNIRLDFDISR